jgi:acyl-coenzyme A thioesterase PaaI-like protein
MQEEYYQKLVEYRNDRNRFAVDNGIIITKISEGYAEVELTPQPHHLNPVGSVTAAASLRLLTPAAAPLPPHTVC